MHIVEQIIVLKNDHETRQLGKSLAQRIAHPVLIFLSGDLGAGKTTLAQAMIEVLQSEAQRPLSPTYSYMNTYQGRIPIIHFDLYRIDNPDQFFALGLDEFLEDDRAIRLVEWPERLGSYLRTPDLSIELAKDKVGRRALLKYFSPSLFIP